MPAEVNPVFQELLQVLWEARTAVQAEVAQISAADSVDVGRLRPLQDSVAEFAGQAVSLAALMLHRRMEPSLIWEAEELFADSSG